MRLLCAEAAMLAFVRRLILIALMLLSGAALAGADESVAPADAAAIQQVIQGQMNAFKVDDWSAAFAYASPSIQTRFESPQIFSQMVTQAYQPVYRPGNFAFGRSKIAGDLIMQEVLITGPDGKDWTAIYQMQKQPDASYKINGVQIVQTSVGPAI